MKLWVNSTKKIGGLFTGVWTYNILSVFSVLSPKSLMINITYRCNSRCVMCNIWKLRPKNELTTEDWSKALNDPIFKNIESLTVSGGEAFLFNDYSRAVKLFIDSMPRLRRLVLNTNGLMTERVVKTIRSVAGYCQDRSIKLVVSISIDGIQNKHDEIRRVKNGFIKTTKTLSELKKDSNNTQVAIASLLLSKNLGNYEETENWLKSTGVDYSFQIVGFHDVFVNNVEEEKELGFSNKKQKRLIEILNKIKKNYRWLDPISYYWADLISMYGEGKERTSPCPFLKDEFAIDSLGDIYYCLSTKPVGNFIKEKRKISEIYFDPKNIEKRNQLPKTSCRNCNSGCGVTRATAYDLKRFLWYKFTGKLWRFSSINK